MRALFAIASESGIFCVASRIPLVAMICVVRFHKPKNEAMGLYGFNLPVLYIRSLFSEDRIYEVNHSEATPLPLGLSSLQTQ